MHRQRDSFIRVLELAARGFGQARRHEDGERARTEQIARGVGLNHVFVVVEQDYVRFVSADAMRKV